MEDVVLIIPAYNEGGMIQSTIKKIPAEFPHIVCVDDGSYDDTAQQILATRAQLVRHSINLGQGAALQTGIDYALQTKAYKYFVTYDADGQHRIADVTKMLKTIKKDKLDIVLGSRFLGDTVGMKTSKRVMLKLAVKVSNIMSGIKLTDAHNGLRVFTRQTAEKLQLQMSDFAHASEIIERIAQLNLKYAEEPVVIVYTDYSHAKGQTMNNAVNILFDVVFKRVTK